MTSPAGEGTPVLQGRPTPSPAGLHARAATLIVYVVVLAAALLEKPEQTTNDTKTPLIEAPAAFLRSAFQLWNPDVSLGELQNQAYGYLFPQGPFFLVGDLVNLAPWVTERLWSVAVIVAGCEGARRLATALGLGVWPAWLAGMAYGLNPRVLGQVATRSAEVLPGAVLPWVVLPLVLVLSGRLRPRTGALWSAAAFVFVGAANGTATMAVLPLPVILIVWGCRRGAAPWSLLGWWSALIVSTSFWWTASLWKLKDYSPPFFDYVEDARSTTATAGFGGAVRGLSNWVGFTTSGDQPTWPAAYSFAVDPWLAGTTLVLAAGGVYGLARWSSPWRSPLLLSSALALACLVVGHDWAYASPLAGWVRDLLDGPLALVRNVHKVDPVLRLPLAVGVGVALAAFETSPLRWWRRARTALVAASVFAMMQPIVALNLRTPGWDEVPGYWHAAADWLADAPSPQRAWLVPGSGFAIQTWGATMDEPLSSVATTPHVTRSQVPLVPGTTILMLDQLESFLQTGSGSPYLGRMLARLGVGYVVVRNDLDLDRVDGIAQSLVGIALARSGGVERVMSFGEAGSLPAIEIFRVDGDGRSGEFALTPESGVVTVAGASPDVLDAVGRGLVPPGDAAVVQGDDGWDRAADVVGDAHRLRARNFGRVHDAEGPVLSPDEPTHMDRVVLGYRANESSRPVTADYEGVTYVDASSSQAFPLELGEIRPENAPFAAVDGSFETGWRSAYFEDPEGQWLDVRLDEPERVGLITVNSPGASGPVAFTSTWLVSAGSVERPMRIDPFTGVGSVDLGGVVADRVRLTAVGVDTGPERDYAAVSLLEVRFGGLQADRTLRVPAYRTERTTTFMFGSRPETRACIPTLLAPDCSAWRHRQPDEGAGIDRSFTVTAPTEFNFRGTAVARATPATLPQLAGSANPVAISASTTYEDDPAVAPRLAHDGSGATMWIARQEDRTPQLTVALPRARTVSRIAVGAPVTPAVSPTRAVISNGIETRHVTLDQLGLFQPLRGNQFTITFSSPGSDAPIGLSELYLSPGELDRPFRGGDPSGAFCGSGPPLMIDGRYLRTRVSALVGDVFSGTPVDVLPCDGPVALDAGEHRIVLKTNPRWQPVTAVLSSSGPPEASQSRHFEVVSRRVDEQVLEVGAGPAALLATSRNANPGWRATLDGEPLAVQQVDGWAQGWRVPSGDGGTVRIWYAPQQSYFVALVVGLVMAGLVLVAAGISVLRSSGSEPGPPVLASVRHRRRARTWWLALPVVPLVWVVGGPVAAAGALVGWLLRLRWLGGSRASAPLAFMLVAAAGVVYGVQLAEQPIVASRLGDVLAALGVMVALVSAPPSERAPAAERA